MTARKARFRKYASLRPLFVLTALVTAILLCACSNAPEDLRARDETYRYSIIFPKGWERFGGDTQFCQASQGATSPDGCHIYVCVSKPPEMFLSTRSDYVNCEQAKDYVTEVLKGQDVDCRASRIIFRKVYAVYYTRTIKSADAYVYQFVSQSYLLWGGMLYTITCYALGDTPQAARELYQKNNDELLRSESTFFIHRPPMSRD